MSNTVRAKVLCTQITVDQDFGHSTLHFSAVYSVEAGSENKAFSDATPALNLSMTIAFGKPVVQLFEQGQEYYLDFTCAAAVVDPRQGPLLKPSSLPKTIVVYGRQGCGKTTHSQALARHFGTSQILDGWTGATRLPTWDTLVLTDNTESALFNEPGGRYVVLTFDEAMRQAGLTPDTQEQRDGQYATQEAEADGGWPSGGRKMHELPENAAARRGELQAKADVAYADAHSGPSTLDAGNASCGSGAQDGGSADCSSSDSGGGSSGD